MELHAQVAIAGPRDPLFQPPSFNWSLDWTFGNGVNQSKKVVSQTKKRGVKFTKKKQE